MESNCLYTSNILIITIFESVAARSVILSGLRASCLPKSNMPFFCLFPAARNVRDVHVYVKRKESLAFVGSELDSPAVIT